MNKTLFYQDKPLFGLDIGFRTIKVMQLQAVGKQHLVSGYGITDYDERALDNGIIVDFDSIAASIHQLFTSGLTGEISTRRVAVSVPAARTYSRVLSLPLLADKDISDAVHLEAEQYIPVPIADLYIDFTITNKTDKTMEVLAVAVPRKIIDSYTKLCQILDLEPVVMESTTGATNRLFRYTDQHSVPTVLVDFGSVATDISVFDRFLAVTGTVASGGDDITTAIANGLGITMSQALTVKVKYGLSASKKQTEIVAAAQPSLDKILREIKRMIRYYEERSDTHSKIEQIVTFGGGANIPGLSEYLIDRLRIPVRACNPWNHILFKHLAAPEPAVQSLYATAASLALIQPKDIFA